MATGSGKTKVMALAVAWQFFNAAAKQEEIAKDYAKTFLLLAPNVSCLKRLKTDFAGGRIFRATPSFPRNLKSFGIRLRHARGSRKGPRGRNAIPHEHSAVLRKADRTNEDEPEEMTAVLGSKPPTKKLELTDFGDRIALRPGKLLTMNDEAHHTHDEDSEWNNVIRRLAREDANRVTVGFLCNASFPEGCDLPLDDLGLPAQTGHRR